MAAKPPTRLGYIDWCMPAATAAAVNRSEDAPLKTTADLGDCTSFGADYGAEVPTLVPTNSPLTGTMCIDLPRNLAPLPVGGTFLSERRKLKGGYGLRRIQLREKGFGR